MEPWQEEDLRQLRMDRRKAALPRCHCCEKPIESGQFLDLEPFGIGSVVCEACVEENTHETWEIM